MADFEIRTDTPTNFQARMRVRQGEIFRTARQTGSWRYVASAIISSNAINDTAVVMLTGGHYDGPHGEPDPDPLAHALSCMAVGIDADAYDDGTHTIQARRMVRRHGDHFDVWNIMVTFTIDSIWNFDSITRLQADISAEHVDSQPGPQPEDPPIVKEGLDDDQIEDIAEKLKEWQETRHKD